MATKTYFINAVELIPVDGSNNIPSVLLYREGSSPLVGYAALSTARTSGELLNENFKVDLGTSDPKSPVATRRKHRTAIGTTKSAAELTSDFIHELLTQTVDWLATQGLSTSPSVLLAEPLAMQTGLVETDWLRNYRDNLKRILSGKSVASIDFLPEPFAVFQYYRYGVRLPSVAERAKHNALVIDFGGGTFDVCVISTTKEGDISQTGHKSKPLAAASIPIGGFFLNRLIAEDLYRQHFANANKLTYKRAADAYHRWLKSERDEDLDTLSADVRAFVTALHHTTHVAEDVKLTLCRNMRHWDLTRELNLSVPINIAADPYKDDGKTISVKYTANDLRRVFHDVWNQYLKGLIKTTFKRAHEELEGEPISVVLLSGGSANIGWLHKLLRRDFDDVLQHADEIISLPDFQEVVAKGLAVECARRFFNKDGDFRSVTYNRLCLVLNPDDVGDQVTRFNPKTEGLPAVTEMPGVLLPSASVLSRFVDRPMLWKFRLSRPPHQKLGYYFLRSSFDSADLDNLQNIEEHSLHTGKRTVGFDQDLKVQLVVAADGTAKPRFTFKTGRSEQDTAHADGRPFYLDMTYGQDDPVADTYLGLDFGSSNSSLSIVTSDSVRIFKQRSTEESWSGLSDLVATLPYPLAEPLGRYVSQTDPTRLLGTAREFLEAALAMAAFIALIDHAGEKHAVETRFFKSLTQRSIGPLWGLFREVMRSLRSPRIAGSFAELLQTDSYSEVNEAVTYFAQLKHEKAAAGAIDVLHIVRLVANVSQKVFGRWLFGFFEQVQRRPFSKENSGRFRQATGIPPFTRHWEYRGTELFSEDQAFVVDSVTHDCVSLQPLCFWDRCAIHHDQEYGHCFLFDRAERGSDELLFKAVGHTCTIDVARDPRYEAVAAQLRAWRNADGVAEVCSVGDLIPIGVD